MTSWTASRSRSPTDPSRSSGCSSERAVSDRDFEQPLLLLVVLFLGQTSLAAELGDIAYRGRDSGDDRPRRGRRFGLTVTRRAWTAGCQPRMGHRLAAVVLGVSSRRAGHGFARPTPPPPLVER